MDILQPTMVIISNAFVVTLVVSLGYNRCQNNMLDIMTDVVLFHTQKSNPFETF